MAQHRYLRSDGTGEWKHLNYCQVFVQFAGLDTKAPLAASYKASGYFIPAIMEKISFFQGQGMAAMGKFGGGYLCRARGTFLIVLQAFVN